MAQLRSGKLRHRVTIQQPGPAVQDSDTGTITRTWQNVLVDEPASIEPVSVREYVASKALDTVIVARVVVRYRDGMHARMRILHGDKIYNPQGWLPDADSGRDYLTAPCSEGLSEGQ